MWGRQRQEELIQFLHVEGLRQVQICIYCGGVDTKAQKRCSKKAAFSEVHKLHSQLDHSMDLFSLSLNYEPGQLGTAVTSTRALITERPALPTVVSIYFKQHKYTSGICF